MLDGDVAALPELEELRAAVEAVMPETAPPQETSTARALAPSSSSSRRNTWRRALASSNSARVSRVVHKRPLPQNLGMMNIAHTSWKVHDISAGRVLGIFSGDTAEAALDDMARRAGHDDFEDLCVSKGKAVDTARANLRIEVALLTYMMTS